LLSTHHNAQALLLETGFDNDEVDDVYLTGDLGRVVWVWQPCGDIELELGVVLNFPGAEFDTEAATILNERFTEHTIQGRVHTLTNILQQNGLTLGNCDLNLPYVVDILGISNDQVVAHLLNPLVGLVLRIYVQSPPQTFGNEHTVLCGEVVCGQSIRLPLPCNCFARKELRELQALAHLDALFFDPRQPHIIQQVAVVGGEGSTVGHEGCCDDAVAEQAAVLLLKQRKSHYPVCLLIGQGGDQFLTAVDLCLQLGQVILKLVHFRLVF